VLDAIESRRGELTVVLIAHRLSTIRWADLIYVVEGGKVVESGDWSSLSTIRDGRFPRTMGSPESDHLAGQTTEYALLTTVTTGRDLALHVTFY